jgi:hypothetical protein
LLLPYKRIRFSSENFPGHAETITQRWITFWPTRNPARLTLDHYLPLIVITFGNQLVCVMQARVL